MDIKQPPQQSEDPFFGGSVSLQSQTPDTQLIDAVRGFETRSTGGFIKVFVLLFSLAIFVAAGVAWWDPWVVCMLVVVLLVHESGHYAAMRFFGYRNVKMFFIPFLGAAVSGRHFNIAAWKKVTVYLAGPLPGIVLSIPLIAAGIFGEYEWMIQLGTMGLILNGLNLLPFLPLDGGWILHLAIFQRSPILELLARTSGVVALLGIAYLTKSRFLFFVAIPLVMALPNNYRLAKFVRSLRDHVLPPPQDDQVPESAIRLLHHEMMAGPLGSLPISSKAPLVVHSYEALIVRAPGFLVTTMILAAYMMSILTTVVGGLSLSFMHQNSQNGVLDLLFLDPLQRVVQVADQEVELVVGEQPLLDSELVVIQYGEATAARKAFELIESQEAVSYSSALVGDMLIATVPYDKPEGNWAASMRPTRIVDTHLNEAVTDENIETAEIISGVARSSLQVLCRHDDEAEAKAILESVFEVPGTTANRFLIPVWSPVDPPTDEQLRCREILKKLISDVSDTETAQTQLEVIDGISKQSDNSTRPIVEQYRKFQIALQEFKTVVDGMLDDPDSGNRLNQSRPIPHAASKIGKADSGLGDRPELDDFIDPTGELLGFAKPATQAHHFASHVSGSWMTDADPNVDSLDVPYLQLFVHRAIDQAATLATLHNYLREKGFSEFHWSYLIVESD